MHSPSVGQLQYIKKRRPRETLIDAIADDASLATMKTFLKAFQEAPGRIALVSVGLTAVATMHLVAVYAAMMGPLVCLWLQWKARRDELAARLDRWLLWLAVFALVAAAMLGALAIVLISYAFPQAYLAAARVLPRSRFWPFGGVELVFSWICFIFAAMLATSAGAMHPGAEAARHKKWASRFYVAVRWLVTAFGCSNLIYHFPPLFVMLGVLSARPNTWGEHLRFTTLLSDAEVQARTAHHLLAALVVTGMVITWYGVRRGGEAEKAIAWGARLAVAALVCQLFSGLWLVMALPVGSREMLLGEDAVAGVLFASSLLGTSLVLSRMAAAALGHAERRATMLTILLVLAIVTLMTAARHRTRNLLILPRENREAMK